jgi:hypothetical protein
MSWLDKLLGRDKKKDEMSSEGSMSQGGMGQEQGGMSTPPAAGSEPPAAEGQETPPGAS